MREALLFLMVCGAAAPAAAVLLDRIAVTVGKDVITQSQVDEEIRVTAFLNGQPLDFSPSARRAAAERLVDQDLIRDDMKVSGWQAQPHTSGAQKLLAQIKRQRFGNDEAAYKAALGRYGISQAELMRHLRWQLAALAYTEFRFQPGIPTVAEARQKPAASKAQPSSRPQPLLPLVLGKKEPQAGQTDETGSAPPPVANAQGPGANAAPPTIEQEMDAWLKLARSRSRIVYHPEAFQ